MAISLLVCSCSSGTLSNADIWASRKGGRGRDTAAAASDHRGPPPPCRLHLPHALRPAQNSTGKPRSPRGQLWKDRQGSGGWTERGGAPRGGQPGCGTKGEPRSGSGVSGGAGGRTLDRQGPTAACRVSPGPGADVSTPGSPRAGLGRPLWDPSHTRLQEGCGGPQGDTMRRPLCRAICTRCSTDCHGHPRGHLSVRPSEGEAEAGRCLSPKCGGWGA